jgi:hypothetical protein
LRGLAKDDCELCVAGFRGVIEGVAGAIAFGGLEEESASRVRGETRETSFAVDVGTDFEIEFMEASVVHADSNLGGVDGLAIRVVDGEVGGTRAKGAVDDRDGVGIGSLLGGEGR